MTPIALILLALVVLGGLFLALNHLRLTANLKADGKAIQVAYQADLAALESRVRAVEAKTAVTVTAGVSDATAALPAAAAKL